MRSKQKRSTAIAAAAMALGAAAPAMATDLVVSSYGGIFETTVRECYVAPFEKETGKKVSVVLGQPTQWVNQVIASPAKPPIDVLILNATFVFLGRDKGILEKVSAGPLPALKDVPQAMIDMLDGYGVVTNFGILGLTYDKRRIKNPPKTYQEFIDRTLKGEWKASIPGAAYSGMPYYVIWGFADMLGGNLDNVDPAFDAIKKMKASGNLSFWTSSTDFLNQLQSGEFEIGLFFDGRTFAYMDEGADWVGFVNPEPGSVMGPTTISKVVNGSPLAWKFIDVAMSPGPQSCFAEKMQYPVINQKAQPSEKVAQRLVKWNETRIPPYEKINTYLPKWLERWNKEIGG